MKNRKNFTAVLLVIVLALSGGAVFANQAVLPGDVNDDTYVNILDLTVLRLHLAGRGVEINHANADVDGDGYVTSEDITMFRSYLTGQREELLPSPTPEVTAAPTPAVTPSPSPEATPTTSPIDPNRPPGSGTVENPYLVSELHHLEWMANTSYGSWIFGHRRGRYFLLTQDIIMPADFNGLDYISISGGTIRSRNFDGVLDGGGNTIVLNSNSRLFVSIPHLISRTSIVRNLYLTGETQRDSPLAIFSSGIIENVHSSINVDSREVTVGGLVRENSGIIVQSSSTGTVTANRPIGAMGGLQIVGGLVGSNVGIIDRSFSIGDVSTESGTAGGLVGFSNRMSGTTAAGRNPHSQISNSYSVGNVVSERSFLVGALAHSSITVENSYAIGDVSSLVTISPSAPISSLRGTHHGGGLTQTISSPVNTQSRFENNVLLSNNLNFNYITEPVPVLPGRIFTRSTGSPRIYNNFSAAHTALNGSLFTERDWASERTHDNIHGADVSPETFGTIEFWRDTLGWDFDTVWEWNPRTNLPILQGFDFPQEHYVTPPGE